MSFVNKLISRYFRNRLPQIEHFMEHPEEVQNHTFNQLIDAAGNTEWGKKYAFKDIDSYDTYAERVPLQDYDEIKPSIDRLLKGEQQVLWPSEIQWFAKSSGTTSDRSKFIPISRESLTNCHYKAGKDVLTIYCNNNSHTRIFDGKGLIMGGSHKVSEFNSRAFFGDLSAVLLQNAPLLADLFRIPDLSLALLDDWEEKLDRVAHASYNQNVTNISGVPSWNLILLKRILEVTGRNNILEVWPNLELFIHGGVSFGPYREQFEKLIPSPDMHYLETYNASEGFFGIQDRPDANDMLLMLDYGIFYEFIPMDAYGQPGQKAIPLSDVDTDTNYAMVITTNAGLWRYMIGDTVRFTGVKPYRIRISGRTKNFINAFGEEVIVDNTDTALQEASRETGAVISEYTAAPIYLNDQQSAAHQYIIEFEIEPNDINRFIHVLDKQIQMLNSDYEAKRSHDLLLKKPKLTCVPKGTFFQWMKSRGKIGGQNKVPRLYNNRKYVDDILGYLKK
ncbi:MAG: hypothetical protein EA394_04995 [Bacteroidia bacterium]|nr:MAG: hypothetical protein EA394_04995 [Bacteroidia bacterium]